MAHVQYLAVIVGIILFFINACLIGREIWYSISMRRLAKDIIVLDECIPLHRWLTIEEMVQISRVSDRSVRLFAALSYEKGDMELKVRDAETERMLKERYAKGVAGLEIFDFIECMRTRRWSNTGGNLRRKIKSKRKLSEWFPSPVPVPA